MLAPMDKKPAPCIGRVHSSDSTSSSAPALRHLPQHLVLREMTREAPGAVSPQHHPARDEPGAEWQAAVPRVLILRLHDRRCVMALLQELALRIRCGVKTAQTRQSINLKLAL